MHIYAYDYFNELCNVLQYKYMLQHYGESPILYWLELAKPHKAVHITGAHYNIITVAGQPEHQARLGMTVIVSL